MRFPFAGAGRSQLVPNERGFVSTFVIQAGHEQRLKFRAPLA